MSIIGFPLLLIPIAICNIIIFLMPGVGFDATLSQIRLPSGAVWSISGGDVLVALGALLLMFEVIKAGKPGGKYVTDHLLSLLVLGGTIAEFVMLPQFATPTVFLLATLMLVDVIAGIALRRRPQPRSARQAPVKPVAAEETRKEPTLAPAAATEPPQTAVPPAASPASSTAASTSAASIAEAVLLDRPQPVAAAPQVQSPALQPAETSGSQQR